jgi:cytochrome b involved in lipid metabolism
MVKLHDSSVDCWSALYGNVYNLTEYGPTHNAGGGPSRVWTLCGSDGTVTFDKFHGDDKQWLTQFETIKNLGSLETPTNPPSPSPEAFPTTPHPTQILDTAEPSKPDPDHILPEELATHNTTTDCWVAFYEHVYNMTDYADLHPGPGASVIHPQCGKNGTQAFAVFHPQRYLNIVSTYIVGNWNPPPTPSPSPGDTHITLLELMTHDTHQDCWVVYYDTVYDMTDFADLHPGPGAAAIHPFCGWIGTEEYDIFHDKSLLVTIESYAVGNLGASSAPEAARTLVLTISIFGAIAVLY